MKVLLMLYPRPWRERYQEEVELLLEAEPKRLRLALDLLAGAIDARLNPKWTPAVQTNTPTTETRGGLMAAIPTCRRSSPSPTQALRSAAAMLGLTLTLTLLGIALDERWPDLARVLILSCFPISFLVSTIPLYGRQYSRFAQAALVVVSALIVIALIWGSVVVEQL